MPRKSSPGLLILFILAVLVFAAIVSYRSRQPGNNDSAGIGRGGASAEIARAGPPDIYPDRTRTPGATNPAVNQENIHENICNPNWSTRFIRPPAHYTNQLKLKQIQEYSDGDANPRDYEEDHLIPLELGGNPEDPRNLWPEPYDTSIPDGGAKSKDRVESFLHKQVCSGNISLRDAQMEIATDWYRVYETLPAD
jgi:hypothetical protein